MDKQCTDVHKKKIMEPAFAFAVSRMSCKHVDGCMNHKLIFGVITAEQSINLIILAEIYQV